MGSGAVLGRSSLIAPAAMAIIAIFAFFSALHEASNLAQTSDSAQGFVVGHAIANGNVLLSGWHLPIDNFYFTDSIPHAAAEAIVGSRPYLMTVVPALIYACMVFVALVVCVRPERPFRANLESIAAIALLLAVPVWTGVWNPMLMSDMHTATAVAALAALAFFARVATADGAIRRFVAGFAFLLTALAIASDPFSLVFAFGPAAAVLAIEALRTWHSPKVLLALVLLAAATAVGLLLPWIIALVGGFTTENDLAPGVVPAGRLWTNLLAALFGILTLWGANPLNVQSVPDGLMFAIRCAALGFVLFALAYVARNLSRDVKPVLLDRLLCAGATASLVACVASAQFAKGVRPETMWHGGPPMRFLVPAVLFASIVACRRMADAFNSSPTPRMRAYFRAAFVAVAGLVLLTGVLQFFSPTGEQRRIENNPAITAAHWLERNRLAQGAGEYWSANLLTAMSGTAIAVRSMVPDRGGLVPYVWVEDQAFYARPPQFAVWQEPNKTGWTEEAVRATWPVCAIRTVAGYRIALLQMSGEFATCSPAQRSAFPLCCGSPSRRMRRIDFRNG